MCFAGLRFLRGELFVFRGRNADYEVPGDITAHPKTNLHDESVTHPIAYHLRRSLIFSRDYRHWNPCDVVSHISRSSLFRSLSRYHLNSYMAPSSTTHRFGRTSIRYPHDLAIWLINMLPFIHSTTNRGVPNRILCLLIETWKNQFIAINHLNQYGIGLGDPHLRYSHRNKSVLMAT